MGWSKVEEIELTVDGITCCASVKGVKKALNVLYGVDDVEVNMSAGKVVVKGTGEQFTRKNSRARWALPVLRFTRNSIQKTPRNKPGCFACVSA